jgi:hypothetical protein
MLMNEETSNLLEAIVDLLDIPPSYYKKAAERYISFGKWLHRPESRVVQFDPDVYLQGSFRYGTVNRPLLKTEEYDLDLASEVKLRKGDLTQEALKRLIGLEVKSYADGNGIDAPPVERNRCWRLDYADDVSFHMDILPCLPEDDETILSICALGVPAHLAIKSVAITDRHVPEYRIITPNWPCSNPRGLGDWFEEKAKPGAYQRIAMLVDGKSYRSIDEVPSYEWKTPLQRTIQILKRHRDVMFKDDPEFAPISMIITVLAAKAYGGETTLWGALKRIVDCMPQYIGETRPRIPNPVNPGEDFADRWAGDSRYEKEFRRWHAQAKVDVEKLPGTLQKGNFASEARTLFNVDLTEKQQRTLNDLMGSRSPVVVASLLSPAATPTSIAFPNRPVTPRKPGGFA